MDLHFWKIYCLMWTELKRCVKVKTTRTEMKIKRTAASKFSLISKRRRGRWQPTTTNCAMTMQRMGPNKYMLWHHPHTHTPFHRIFTKNKCTHTQLQHLTSHSLTLSLSLASQLFDKSSWFLTKTLHTRIICTHKYIYTHTGERANL